MGNVTGGANGNVANVGNDKRLDTRSITEESETLITIDGQKFSISTSLIAVTGTTAIAVLTNTAEENLIVSSNALFVFDVAGTATSTGSVLVEAMAAENTGTFSDMISFNNNVGKSTVARFTAREGDDGATFMGVTQSISGFFELPVNVVANAGKFVIAQGSSIGITIVLPTGVTAANIVWQANLYFDNSTELRNL